MDTFNEYLYYEPQYEPHYEPQYEPPKKPSPMQQYEDNRLRETDERDAVQKKTFTKWVNKHLLKAGRKVIELFEDLRDGHNLISLLEVLTQEILPRERGKMRFHKIQNVKIALDFLTFRGIKLVNIRADEIVDGNPKLTLGLIWTIILHFQVSEVVVVGQPEDLNAKDALLLWSRRMVEGYPGVKITDFSRSWRDGKAFLAIIHRNRPDLVDFRKVRHSTPRQNLEQAFSIAEREFGVTRLLDPEDIDVSEPDEKSVITYVSSLYDVFPEVPSVEESLRDNEHQIRVDQYRELASSLLNWIRNANSMMLDRSFPATLVEMRALLAEFSRFRIEDVPPRLEMKQKLLRVFDELHSLSGAATHLGIEEDFFPDSLNRMWNKFSMSLQERDNALQAEMARLERLQRLAEKIHRESKNAEDSLFDIERKIVEEETRVEIIHPFEAKRICDTLDRALKNTEESIRNLFRDVQSLQDGKYAQSDQMYKRVSNLQSHISNVRTKLFTNVIQKLISKSYVEEGVAVTKRTEVVTEVRLIETSEAFRHLQDCLGWIESKQKGIEDAEYGQDMNTIQAELMHHKQEHHEISSFRAEIDRCISDRFTLSEEEQKLYTEWLSKLEVAYSLLTNTSNRRLKSLESLIDFIQVATTELVWLSDREEIEISRDWSSIDLNVSDLQDFYRNLMHELESREAQFNSVQDRGEAMVLNRHPASKTIEAYMVAMQSQWSWLLQLTICLESHLNHAAAYHQFFTDAQQCEQWMRHQAEFISSRYNQENLPVEEAEKLLIELQEFQAQLSDYGRRIEDLNSRSRDVIPLLQRTIVEADPVRVRTLCNYNQTAVNLQKGEECMLLDNEHRIKWRVKSTTSGNEGIVPSVCFLIPPPNKDAIDFAERLKVQLGRLTSLKVLCHKRLKRNKILASILIVKSWNVNQFLAMDPSERERFWRMLNEDAERILAEGGDERELNRLREELKECNEIFLHLSSVAFEEDARKSKSPNATFLQRLDSVQRSLQACEQDLTVRLQEPIPRDRDTLQKAHDKQQDFERDLETCEDEVNHVKSSFASISLKPPQTEAKLNLSVKKYQQLYAMSHIYVERLKSSEVILLELDLVRQIIADYEIALAQCDNMPEDLEALRNYREQLQDLQISSQQHQPKIDQMKIDVAQLRELLESSRLGVSRHHDLESVEKEVADLTSRWDRVCIQIVERLRSGEASSELLSLYQTGLKTEELWSKQMQKKIKSQPELIHDVMEVKKLLEPTMAIYNGLGERKHQIENVNRYGGQYIREAKIHDKRLKDYRNKLEEVDMQLLDSMRKKPRLQDGASVVKTDLDSLNTEYMDMVKWTNARLKQITKKKKVPTATLR